MKRVVWILIFLAAMLLSAWIVIFSDLNLKDDPIAARLALAYYAFQCLGPFWMLYDWFIRRQKKHWKPFLWLFFVPLGFLWYRFNEYIPTRLGDPTRP
ncbi:MAG: hypothetical protein WAN23_15850 [Candidatus Acidiferrales bacterium]